MTSLSSLASGNQTTLSTAFPTSPKQRMLDAISSGVGAGSISTTDETALDSAVDAIDTSLRGTSSSTSSSSSLDPTDMKDRIDGLIDGQVTSGALTSDQAETLKQVFSQSAPKGTEGPHVHGGRHHGHHPSEDASSSTATSSTSSSSTGDLLSTFVKQLQDSQGRTGGYGADGTRGGTSQAGSLLLDFEA